MPAASHMHVRQMEIGDFEFVCDLAAKQSNFTVPPPYVLWLFLRIKDAVCLVVELSGEEPLGYLLAVPIEAPDKALHVWQLAVTPRGARSRAASTLVEAFYSIARKLKVRTIAFSSVAGSAEYRAIRRAIWKVFVAKPQLVGIVPRTVSRTQTEYRIQLSFD